MHVRSMSAVTAAAALLLTGGGIAAAAEPAPAQVCFLQADVPNTLANADQGLNGCSYTRTIDGHIWEDRGAFPDDLVGYKRFQGGVERVFGHCNNGPGDYYSVADVSSGGEARSDAAYACD